jgi:hypothetical protein
MEEWTAQGACPADKDATVHSATSVHGQRADAGGDYCYCREPKTKTLPLLRVDSGDERLQPCGTGGPC